MDFERHNNTLKVNGTSLGRFPFDLYWVSTSAVVRSPLR
jgi:hypothetical protein